MGAVMVKMEEKGEKLKRYQLTLATQRSETESRPHADLTGRTAILVKRIEGGRLSEAG